jgi:hypothetical protein
MTDNRFEFIKQRLAPCGLHCGRCFAFSEGQIHLLSSQLRAALGNFGPYAVRFAELLNNPVYSCYPEFRKFLDHLASGECGGCRKEKCKLFSSCGVRPCAEEQKVDFRSGSVRLNTFTRFLSGISALLTLPLSLATIVRGKPHQAFS